MPLYFQRSSCLLKLFTAEYFSKHASVFSKIKLSAQIIHRRIFFKTCLCIFKDQAVCSNYSPQNIFQNMPLYIQRSSCLLKLFTAEYFSKHASVYSEIKLSAQIIHRRMKHASVYSKIKLSAQIIHR